MLERLCPHCGSANPATQRRCRTCGDLIEQPLARRASAALRLQRVQLPARWQQPARIVALGVLSIAADVGMQWLQRRHAATAAPRANGQRIVAAQQRIVERWEAGQLRERMVERTLWMDDDAARR